MERNNIYKRDKFNINGHKLIYHISRIYDWLNGKIVYPIYIEVGLTSVCNQRCIFCAFDYLGYRSKKLRFVFLEKFLIQAQKKGVKSILYAGEGEPLLHEEIIKIVNFTKNIGIDVAITTNATMLNSRMSEELLRYLTWLRISLDAGTEKTYSYIHRTGKKEFIRVLNNIEKAVKIRDKNKFSSTIGVQFLLIPQNFKEVVKSVQIAKSLGVDYFIIKPYSQHPESINRINCNFLEGKIVDLEKELSRYSSQKFEVIFRRSAIRHLSEKKPYEVCLGLDFITYIDAEGNLYPCSVFLGKKKFVFGNICRKDFEKIWEGERRRKIVKLIQTEWDIDNCRKACRLDMINRYLWELKNPPLHINFI